MYKRGVAIIDSLDVQGAFRSAWWPTILRGLREAECPRKLYYLKQDYLKDRKAIITIKNISKEKEITKGCHKVHVGAVEYLIQPSTRI